MEKMWAFFLLMLAVSYFSGSRGEESSTYKCFPEEKCEDDPHATYARTIEGFLCCRAGDAIQISVSGEGFEYNSTTYFYTRSLFNDSASDDSGDVHGIQKRDTSSDSGAPEVETTCTCSPVDRSQIEMTLNSIQNTLDSLTDWMGW